MNMSCDFAAIPAPLAEREQWVCWKPIDRGGKATKVPINVHNSKLADSSDPATWATLEEAVPYARRHACGVGFVFADDDPFAGVDLDACLDPDTGRLADWAAFVAWHLDSYTEVSPSGRGIKIIVKGNLPPGRRGWGGNGLYDRCRFFTITGQLCGDYPPEPQERGDDLVALHALLFPARQPIVTGARQPGMAVALTDDEVIQRAERSANGHKFRALWSGDSSGYSSQSEADAALVGLLRFWVGDDEDRIDRLFRQSGLAREKWDRADYRRRTLALVSDGAIYTPREPVLLTPHPPRRRQWGPRLAGMVAS
jgi:primase-polymerase (primpol)-like protein